MVDRRPMEVRRAHYANMPRYNIQQYFTALKLLIFRKFLTFFLIFAQNKDCGYTLEPLH